MVKESHLCGVCGHLPACGGICVLAEVRDLATSSLTWEMNIAPPQMSCRDAPGLLWELFGHGQATWTSVGLSFGVICWTGAAVGCKRLDMFLSNVVITPRWETRGTGKVSISSHVKFCSRENTAREKFLPYLEARSRCRRLLSFLTSKKCSDPNLCLMFWPSWLD